MLGPEQRQIGHGVPAALNPMVGVLSRLACQHGGALRLDDEALNGGIVLLERRGAPGERAARARKVTEGVDPAAGLAEKLRPGVQVVCAEVAGLAELIGPKRAPLGRDPLRDLLHQRQVAARHLAGDRAGQLIHQDDLSARAPTSCVRAPSSCQRDITATK